jgi:hypothetical protein
VIGNVCGMIRVVCLRFAIRVMMSLGLWLVLVHGVMMRLWTGLVATVTATVTVTVTVYSILVSINKQ